MEGTILDPEQAHRCRSDERCLARTSEGAALTTNPYTLCVTCVRRLEDQLLELPRIRYALPLYKGGIGGESGEAKVSSSSVPQTPLSVHVVDLIDEIDDVLDRTGNLTIDALIRQPEMLFKLWRGRGWEMDYLDGVQRALEIGKVWGKADSVIGISRAWQHRIARCPECGHRTLGNYVGEDTVHCTSCEHSLTRLEYEKLCKTVAKIKASRPKEKKNA